MFNIHSASAQGVVGSSLEGVIRDSETLRFTFEYPDEGLTVRICTHNGTIILYGSFTISNPNKALHDFALDAFILGNICEDVFVQQSNSKSGKKKRQAVPSKPDSVYISIEGLAEKSTFTLTTSVGNTTESKH